METKQTSAFESRNQIPPSLEEAQAFVGGYVEMIQLAPDVQLLVNEEGQLLGLPVNYTASRMAKRVVVGPAMMLCGKAVWT